MRNPLFSGVIYILLGTLFTFLAINSVNENGWGLFDSFAYVLMAFAAYDIGSGIRLILLHFKIKRHMREKQKK